MKKFKVTTTAIWETIVEAETEEEALEIFDSSDYGNYEAEFDVVEVI